MSVFQRTVLDFVFSLFQLGKNIILSLWQYIMSQSLVGIGLQTHLAGIMQLPNLSVCVLSMAVSIFHSLREGDNSRTALWITRSHSSLVCLYLEIVWITLVFRSWRKIRRREGLLVLDKNHSFTTHCTIRPLKDIRVSFHFSKCLLCAKNISNSCLSLIDRFCDTSQEMFPHGLRENKKITYSQM